MQRTGYVLFRALVLASVMFFISARPLLCVAWELPSTLASWGLGFIIGQIATTPNSSWERPHEDIVLCSMRHKGEWPGTLFYATCRRMFNP